jgi:iron complex outermembrane receptor protein
MRVLIILLFSTCSTFQGFSQGFLIGKVTDSRGKPIAGAIISIPGTYLGTASDANGDYRIGGLKHVEQQVEAQLLGFVTQQKRINPAKEKVVNWTLVQSAFIADEVIISATRADDKSAMAYTTLSKTEISKQNFGQDMPTLLNSQPSVVVNSDAGTGIGYSGIRVRGSDPTRTNITVNGIPMNDAESHGLFWVNMPDFASSVSSAQLQRGVGTSTNGAGAFGATLNLQTNELKPAHADLTSSAGSFGTIRNSLDLGTGLLNGFTFDLRLSQINSDGFVDRASSDLKSFFASGAWYSSNTTIRANIFSGEEKTYQAWYGLPQDSMNTNRRYNPAGSYFNSDGKEQFYENQTDNYQQDHYQLFLTHQTTSTWLFNLAFHYTRGKGYYEEYRSKDELSNYGIAPVYFGQKTLINGTDTMLVPSDTISKSSLIRQRWLDNHFYGTVFSASWTPSNRVRLLFGGGLNRYDGLHYGSIIWAEYSKSIPSGYRYYQDTARKSDLNFYTKATVDLLKGVNLFIDLQVRSVNYSFLGFNSLLNAVQQTDNLLFFNPKAGLTWDLNAQHRLFSSFSIGNREPVRDDYTNSSSKSRPKPEHLQDTELGYRLKGKKIQAGLTAYFMNYKNQLVLTGAINDVGAYNRTNTPQSYRLGIELEAAWQILNWLNWSGNIAFSKNKIKSFAEYVDDYDNGTQLQNVYTNTDISFSPGCVASSTITLKPISGFSISFISKYVGKQFLDNTQSDRRKLDAFMVSGIRLNFSPGISKIKGLELGFMVNNLFNVRYAPNGYTFSGYSEKQRYDYNYYFPQAGRNFLGMVQLKF